MTTISSARKDSEDEEPSEAIRERLIDDFREFSGVDQLPLSEAEKRDMAVSFLTQVAWDVQTAADNYLIVYGDFQAASISQSEPKRLRVADGVGESSRTGSSTLDCDEGLLDVPIVKSPKRPALEVTLDDSSDDEVVSPNKKVKKTRREFRMITYNINGSNEENRVLRTEAVCRIIDTTNADIIVLQDIVPTTATILGEKLNGCYEIVSSEGERIAGDNEFPFTLSLFRKDSVQVINHQTIDYQITRMMRTMLKTDVMIDGIKFTVINTHLEGDRKSISERVKQFEQCYALVKGYPEQDPVIIAGDLCMDDHELAELGGLPPDFLDSWDVTGRKRECLHTLTSDSSSSTSRRDRILLRDTSPPKIVPVLFNFIGSERLKPQKCFPSDHYGILCVFKTSPK